MRKFLMASSLITLTLASGCASDFSFSNTTNSRFSSPPPISSPKKLEDSASGPFSVGFPDFSRPQHLADGLDWMRLQAQWHGKNYDFLVVTVDPRRRHLQLYENKDEATAQTLQEVQQQQKALLAVNGAFFGEQFEALGFLESEGKMLHGFSSSQLMNGVLTMDRFGAVRLFSSDDFSLILKRKRQSGHKILAGESLFDFAIQNGPILLDEKGNNALLSDDGKMASRTAIGLDHDGNIRLILLKQSLFEHQNGLSLYQFTELLRNNDFFRQQGLHSLLNLDGGPSTGIAFESHSFPEMNRVQNMILVK